MENYLSLETALKELASNTPIPNEFNQIANLATYGEITPTVRYNGILSIDDNEPITAICFITSHELIDLIDDNQSEITLQTAIIYDGAKTGLEHGQAVKLHTAKTYRQKNILIPEHDITRQLFNDLTDPATADKELIAELYARIDRLENQLDKVSDTPANEDKSSRNQDDKLIATLALLLAEKSNLFKRGSKPNAEQIGIAINHMASHLMENEDTYGLTQPAQRIRKALSNTIGLIKKS